MAEEKKLEGPIYGVPWIEVEYGWGERPGYLLFTDLEQCIEDTKEASKRWRLCGTGSSTLLL